MAQLRFSDAANSGYRHADGCFSENKNPRRAPQLSFRGTWRLVVRKMATVEFETSHKRGQYGAQRSKD